MDKMIFLRSFTKLVIFWQEMFYLKTKCFGVSNGKVVISFIIKTCIHVFFPPILN